VVAVAGLPGGRVGKCWPGGGAEVPGCAEGGDGLGTLPSGLNLAAIIERVAPKTS
jgi:hypothetical protein